MPRIRDDISSIWITEFAVPLFKHLAIAKSNNFSA